MAGHDRIERGPLIAAVGMQFLVSNFVDVELLHFHSKLSQKIDLRAENRFVTEGIFCIDSSLWQFLSCPILTYFLLLSG